LSNSSQQLRFRVVPYGVDWLLPVAALGALRMPWAALLLGSGCVLFNAIQTRTIVLSIGEGGRYVQILRLWHRGDARRTLLSDSRLSYWYSAFCRGLEVRSPELNMLASAREGRPWRIPSALGGEHVKPRIRLRRDAVLSNVPNLVSGIASLVTFSRTTPSTLGALALVVCAVTVATSLYAAVHAAPLLLLQSEEARVAQ
jgi:hypothetical protein